MLFHAHIYPVWKNSYSLSAEDQDASAGMPKAMLTFHNQFAASHSFLSHSFPNRSQNTQLTRLINHNDPWIAKMLTRPKSLPLWAGTAELCTSTLTNVWIATEHYRFRTGKLHSQRKVVMFTQFNITHNPFFQSLESIQTGKDNYCLYWKLKLIQAAKVEQKAAESQLNHMEGQNSQQLC